MHSTLKSSSTFYKGKPFWENQGSSKKIVGINQNGILITVRKILLQEGQIKTKIRIRQIQPLETRGLRKNQSTLGCLLAQLHRRRWLHIFWWQTKINREEIPITVINRRDRNEGIPHGSKEKMEVMVVLGQRIILTRNRMEIETLPMQMFPQRALAYSQALRKN